MGLTPKQQNIYNYIIHFQRENGYSPSQREIANNFGFKSLGTVQNYIKRLEQNDLLKKTWNSKRGIEVLQQENTAEMLRIPLLGKVAAGIPIEYHIEEEIDIPASYFTSDPKDIFALEVEGDSMIGEGILNGDIVFIRKQDFAKNGDTIVANIDGEATIKKFQKDSKHITLISANTKYAPIIIKDSDTFNIEGILLSLYRRY